jgi:hypothetical protein
MSQVDYTVIIPTKDRPVLLERAVRSALAQTIPPQEVLVVDDGSVPPVSCLGDARVRILRLDLNRGVGAARNAGLAAAATHWVTFLDDDDELLPHMAATSLRLIEAGKDMPAPIAALSAMEVVDLAGRTVEVRTPPTLPRGRMFALEDIPEGQSFLSKQTLFIAKDVLQGIGGWDEAFRTRETTELFLRLNQACSLIGGSDVVYRQHRHAGARLSRNRSLRMESFERLVQKHGHALKRHPQAYLRMLLSHARMLRRDGDHLGYALTRLRAAWVWLRR